MSYLFFKRNHSTDMCVHAPRELISCFKEHSSPAFICYADASKPFDQINHWKMFRSIWPDLKKVKVKVEVCSLDIGQNSSHKFTLLIPAQRICSHRNHFNSLGSIQVNCHLLNSHDSVTVLPGTHLHCWVNRDKLGKAPYKGR